MKSIFRIVPRFVTSTVMAMNGALSALFDGREIRLIMIKSLGIQCTHLIGVAFQPAYSLDLLFLSIRACSFSLNDLFASTKSADFCLEFMIKIFILNKAKFTDEIEGKHPIVQVHQDVVLSVSLRFYFGCFLA